MGDRERIGSGPVIGHLTSVTPLRPDAIYRADDFGALHADAELAVQLGSDIDGSMRRCATSAPAAEDYVALVRSAAVLLGAVGERLRAGDQLITGSIVQVPVAPGDDVLADLGALGRVGLSIAA